AWLAGAAPALLGGPDSRFLALARGGRRRVWLWTPEGGLVARPAGEVRAWLCAAAERPVAAEVDGLLRGAGVPGVGREPARQRLMDELLAGAVLGRGWLVRPAGTAALASQAREARLGGPLAVLLGAHVGVALVWVLAWWLLGRLALEGRLD